MIVDPNFLDHWKTKMLVFLTGEPTAPFVVLRLWAHCQERQTWHFKNMHPFALKAICNWEGDGENLKKILIECRWIEDHPTDVILHDWDIVNASLVKNWFNGKNGGRPKKETQEKPNGNPTETQRKPNGNPLLTQYEPKNTVLCRTGAIEVRSIVGDDETSCFSNVDKLTLLKNNPTGTQEKPNDNPTGTQEKPNDNPTETQEKPNDNPTITDKIREDKIREEEEIAGSGKPDTSRRVERNGEGMGSRMKLVDEEWLGAVRAEYGKIGVNVDHELVKLRGWLLGPKGRGKQLTRARLVNWLNRCDPAMGRVGGAGGRVNPVTGI